MKKKVFTTGEVALICGVSADTVSRWFDLGQIEGYRLGPGGDRRIPFEHLRKFMVSHGIPLERLDEGDRRVLIIDDDPYYLDLIAAALGQEEEFVVLTASTGFDAGALVIEHNPQMLIVDLDLSEMDGRQVCERVKGRTETRNSRILGMSAFLDEEEADTLAEHGVDAFLRKPFSVEDLNERVKQLFELPNAKLSRPRRRGA